MKAFSRMLWVSQSSMCMRSLATKFVLREPFDGLGDVWSWQVASAWRCVELAGCIGIGTCTAAPTMLLYMFDLVSSTLCPRGHSARVLVSEIGQIPRRKRSVS